MLKFIYDNENDIPEAFKSHYKKRDDGKWVLEIEGAVAREKLDEFRETNTNLLKAKQALEKKFEGIDPDEYVRLKGAEEDILAGKIKGTSAEKVLEQRTAAMKAQHEKEKAELTGKLDAANGQLARLTITEAAVAEGLKRGLRPTAKDDLAARVNGVFKLKDGKPVAYNADGSAEIYGKDGTALTIAEFLDGLMQSAAHLFEESKGQNANGSPAGGGGKTMVGNPFAKDTWNLTHQAELIRKSPGEAARLAKAAGKPVHWAH